MNPESRQQRHFVPCPLTWACYASTVVFCCAVASVKGEYWAGADVSKTAVHEDPPAASKFVSVAYSATREGCRAAALVGGLIDGFAVIVDGKEGPCYEDIREETPIFSPNGLSLAYCARKEGKWRWVIDGVEGPPFNKLTATSFAFSADGKRHAYIAVPGFGRNVLVLDGKVVAGGEAGKPIPFDAAPVFSPNGSRLAYVEVMHAERKTRVVLDGKPGSWNKGVSMRFSSGFGAFGPATAKGSERARPQEYGMDFSADSKHFAYGEIVEKGQRMVIDGVPGPAHTKTGIDLALAPDGSDFAYMADVDGQLAIVRRRSKPLPIESIVDGTLTFSPDGKHLAFAGTRGGKAAVWLDGEAVPADIPIHDGGIWELRFSPDSKQIAYLAGGAEKFQWIVDGKAGPAMESYVFDGFDFSPDSARFCYLLPLGSGKGVGIVVDGKLRGTHPQAQGVVFRNDGSLEYLATDEDRQLFRFRVTGL